MGKRKIIIFNKSGELKLGATHDSVMEIGEYTFNDFYGPYYLICENDSKKIVYSLLKKGGLIVYETYWSEIARITISLIKVAKRNH